MNQGDRKDQKYTKYPSPKDIVIFQPELDGFGGEERVILALSKELHARGKPHSVLCYWDHMNLAKYAQWPLRVYALKPARNFLSKALSLRRCLAYLHKNGSPIPILFNIQSAYHAGTAVNSPYHLRIPDTFSLLDFKTEEQTHEKETFIESLFRPVSVSFRNYFTAHGIRKPLHFITNTAALRNEMEHLYGRKAEVIYLGGFGSPHYDRAPRERAPIELFTVSRLETSKRIDWILQGLAETRGNTTPFPQWRLHIAGKGPELEALEKMSADLGLSDAVIFHGFVSDEQLHSLYEKSHVFLMPAKQGYGLPAIEALYYKLGLVLSEESGVVELLENTSWVSVARGGKAGFVNALKDMLLRVNEPDFFDRPLPELPTEESWAREMIKNCGW
jgi:glycosyltransferase involved in cell wall biosynthesis